MNQVAGSNNSYKPITNTAWVRARFCKLQKGCTRLAAASDKVYQLLAHGRWFFPGTPASSTTKTGRHDIDEILLKVELNTQKINQSFTVVASHLIHNMQCKTETKVCSCNKIDTSNTFIYMQSVFQLCFEILRIIASFIKISAGHSLITGVSKWVDTRYFYPSEIVYSTGRNY